MLAFSANVEKEWNHTSHILCLAILTHTYTLI